MVEFTTQGSGVRLERLKGYSFVTVINSHMGIMQERFTFQVSNKRKYKREDAVKFILKHRSKINQWNSLAYADATVLANFFDRKDEINMFNEKALKLAQIEF